MRHERVATAERSEVIARLSRALDEGHLSLDQYDARVAAVGTATYATDLVAQLDDLPPDYAWLPPTAVVPSATPRRGLGSPRRPEDQAPATAQPRSSGRAALVLGILALPTSFCLIGGVLGIVAIVLSFRGDRPKGLSPAMVGRVFGIVGLVLSLGAGFSLVYAMTHSLGP